MIIAALLLWGPQVARASMSSHEASGVTAIAFGSCNRQNKPQTHWATIQQHNAEVFVWTGDSVYAKKTSVPSLADAYRNLSHSAEYQAFAASTAEVHGVWDDHDYGVNDGGKRVNDKAARKALFDRHILRATTAGDGPMHATFTKRFRRSGATVRVILLDTRSHRDDHYIPSVGQYKVRACVHSC
jgi:alkaline phosphatase D